MGNVVTFAPGVVMGRSTGAVGGRGSLDSGKAPAVGVDGARSASLVPDGATRTVLLGFVQPPPGTSGIALAGTGGGLLVKVVPQVELFARSFNPPPGTPIYVTQAISFVVESNTGDLTPFVLKVNFPAISMWEVAFDSKSFSPQYEGSTAEQLGAAWKLTILRKSGWPSSPTFSPIPVANVEIAS